MLMGKANPCWSLQDLMSLARNLMISLKNYRSNHVFRNVNKFVDALANIGAFTPNLVTWDKIYHILGHVCKLIHHNSKVLSI